MVFLCFIHFLSSVKLGKIRGSFSKYENKTLLLLLFGTYITFTAYTKIVVKRRNGVVKSFLVSYSQTKQSKSGVVLRKMILIFELYE